MATLHIEDFDYVLPADLIAQSPAPRRDHARLLELAPDAGTGVPWRHRRFCELPGCLAPGDCLVINDSRVLPARLRARKRDGGGRVEILLVRRRSDGSLQAEEWEALVRPGRRLPPGTRLELAPDLEAEVLADIGGGRRLLRFSGHEPARRLRELGELPLPPYIRRRPEDPERYQTVYSRREGSVAAPTAGLHFTPELIERLRSGGIQVVSLTLHVGLGTFLPVRVERIEDHEMHAEWYHLPEETVRAVSETRRRGGRVVAVGTTVTRVLESAAGGRGLEAGSGWTRLFIRPGFRFRVVDGLVTNFHLPRSTLLMLVAAFYGRERLLAAYREAVRCRYRFFSFGDAMLLWRRARHDASI